MAEESVTNGVACSILCNVLICPIHVLVLCHGMYLIIVKDIQSNVSKE